MVSLFGIFQTGAQSLGAQQRGLSVTAENIANVNTEGYSRQRVRLVAGEPVPAPDGLFGGGVRVGGLDRLRDEALDAQIRCQLGAQAFYRNSRAAYDGLQAALVDTLAASVDDLGAGGEVGLNQALLRFFDAFSELSLEPESLANRTVAVEEARNLADAFRGIHNGLREQVAGLNRRVPALVDRVNAIAAEIASLNARIAHLELGGARTASGLRDERGRLLAELSAIAPIRIVETETGAANVSLAGALLVSNDRAYGIEAVAREGDPFGRYDVVASLSPVRVLNGAIGGGELGAVLHLRDEVVPGYIQEINTLARTLIWEANRIHSRSAGLAGFETVTGAFRVTDPDLPLQAAGVPFPVQAGSLTIRVADEAGEQLAQYSIDLDPAVDSLRDVAERIDAADGTVGGGNLTASVNPDGSLTIAAGTGTLSFASDSSGFLAAIGVNTLFSGTGSDSIAVSDALAADPRLLAVSATGAVGDNTGALELAALRDARVLEGGRASLTDSYRALVARLGTEAGRADELETAAGLMVDSLTLRQEEISGVSTDEEAVNLMRYQRAFEAAARLITTVDEMIATIIERTGLAGR